ncbi:hypothetical protein LTR41_011230 [Exophiala xenobiotica]|nr:hypothetical protein LTR41_011230 [Exophiala xenobiotica]KAK5550940.1 hypothetical protein LTR46_011049 [Exophiala xenobiotica]
MAYMRIAQDMNPQQLAKAPHAPANRHSERKQATPVSMRDQVAMQETKNLNSAMAALIKVHDKMAVDLAMAESEVAWGKLTHADLRNILTLLRSIMLPLSGISTLPIISQRLPHDKTSTHQMPLIRDQWKLFLRFFLQEMEDSAALVMLGIQHAIVMMGVASPKAVAQLTGLMSSQKDCDVEKPAQALIPGSSGFASCFETELQGCYNRRQDRRRRGSQVRTVTESHTMSSTFSVVAEKDDEETFKLLFLEHLMQVLRQSAYDLVTFADRQVAQDNSKQDQLIFPGGWSWRFDWSTSSHDGPDTEARDGKASMGGRRRDPEHLPTTNLWERCGEKVGLLPHILASQQSAFGFRAATASFSVGLLAYLRQTQDFFFEQRLIWVLIVIVIGMSPTSGASFFSFFARIIGTIIAFAFSLVVWYVADGHTAGVIVLLYVANTIGYYFYVKMPKLLGPSVIAIVTLNVIVAYELQVNKIGIPKAESSGQPYYPVYQFGSYKLLCVVIGCAIALVWTVFPYPLSSSSQARKVLGRSLFVLANFYSCVHTTIELWIVRPSGDVQEVSRSLGAAKDRLFAEEMQLITALRMHSRFSKFDPPLGGKFPTESYNRVAPEIQTILISMALMAQTIRSLGGSSPKRQEENWLQHLSQAIKSTNFNSHVTTSLLCHLSAAVSYGIALPPYLSPPAPLGLARELRNLSAELMDIKHADDSSFSAFASLEVLSAIISASLSRLVDEVKTLVGEVSFDGYVKSAERAEMHTD